MATFRVRYLIERPGSGGLPRYFWQPSSPLRAQGWRPQRVPLDWQAYTDPVALQAAAIARAEVLSAEMDAARDAAALAAQGAARSGLNVAPSAVNGPGAESPRTLGVLMRQYEGSDVFAALAPATQRGYRQCLAKLDAWAGDAPVRAIDDVRVQKLLRALSGTPAYAAATVRVLRLLLAYGRRTGWRPWLPFNAAENPGISGAGPSGLIWPAAAVAAFVEAADAMGRHSMGTAVLLNEWLGQREGDILRMPRTILRHGTLLVRQSKTGAGVQLPVGQVPHLAARLEREMARAGATGATPIAILVNEETGAPYKADNFRHVFARVRARAAAAHPSFQIDHMLPGRDMADADAFTVRMCDLTFMQLRHTAVTRLAEAGCDAPLIAAITGHSLETVNSLMRRYLVRTAEQARMAFQKRMDAEAR